MRDARRIALRVAHSPYRSRLCAAALWQHPWPLVHRKAIPCGTMENLFLAGNLASGRGLADEASRAISFEAPTLPFCRSCAPRCRTPLSSTPATYTTLPCSHRRGAISARLSLAESGSEVSVDIAYLHFFVDRCGLACTWLQTHRCSPSALVTFTSSTPPGPYWCPGAKLRTGTSCTLREQPCHGGSRHRLRPQPSRLPTTPLLSLCALDSTLSHP